jgi:GR25 family glycosyltransferase involved in LPS biosynthesis
MAFNWIHYKMLNPDLAKSGVNSMQQCINHYQKFGKNEKRHINIYNRFPWFNWTKYRDNNNFGLETKEECENHFLTSIYKPITDIQVRKTETNVIKPNLSPINKPITILEQLNQINLSNNRFYKIPIINSDTIKLKNTFIINLEERADRKEKSVKQVEKISDDITIFKAIKFTPGYIGCSASHIEVLKKAIELNLEYIMICEDDIVILNDSYVLNGIDTIMKTQKWDVIIVCGVVNKEQRIDDTINKVIDCQCLTGYIVNSSYYNILLKNFVEGYDNLIKINQKSIYAIDMYWKRLQLKDKWYCLKDKYTYQEEGYSNIENCIVDYKKFFNISKD